MVLKPHQARAFLFSKDAVASTLPYGHGSITLYILRACPVALWPQLFESLRSARPVPHHASTLRILGSQISHQGSRSRTRVTTETEMPSALTPAPAGTPVEGNSAWQPPASQLENGERSASAPLTSILCKNGLWMKRNHTHPTDPHCELQISQQHHISV